MKINQIHHRKKQRHMAKAIKRARIMALIAFSK
uniref:Ribosomal protein S18 n=1 Tax=Cyanidiaceae sp. MX-AZ01 TaxID=1503164 RepID=A0A060AEL5_9RHOD|nr:ribosomal protein S18 [Cyanidiaceae sp. MX-AZ01]UNJ15436.1 ribosomal protein S18 [Cyanidioschyzonaceae sp. 1]